LEQTGNDCRILSERTVMPDVYWQIAAQRRLLIALTPAPQPDSFAVEYRRLCEVLARTFSKAVSILVRDRLAGFRIRGDVHVLLVEVVHQAAELPIGDVQGEGQPKTFRIGKPDFDDSALGTATRTTAHIVKVGEPAALRKELEAWESARPIGLTHHSIMMVLRPGATNAAGEPESLIYEDAHHILGGSSIVSLEEACLDCVLWGLPSPQSLVVVIKAVYDFLGNDFYARSYVMDGAIGSARRLRELSGEAGEIIGAPPDEVRRGLASTELDETFPSGVVRVREWLQKAVNLERLRERLTRWTGDWRDSTEPGAGSEPERLRVRREVVAMLADHRDFFLDAVDYLKSVLRCREYCPLLLWGCSHGDLHGRNVLVSLVGGSATLPAVFDYEDMDLDNLVTWDFVKLEMELKVRALHQIYRGEFPHYVAKVREFESYLAEKTHAFHDERQARDEQFTLSNEAKRLAEIILAIRDSAQEHVGRRRRRDRQWLEEYYFLLACYGVSAARFETYQSRDVAAALISAGAAARLLTRPRFQLEAEIRAAQERATSQLSSHDKGGEPAANDGEMSHHARLAFATKLARSGMGYHVKTAIELLKELQTDYPHVLAIDEELVLAYLTDERESDAEKLLQGVTRRYQQLSEEMHCRVGRYWKDKAVKSDKDGSQTADSQFKQSLVWYRRAFAMRGHYYPGINVATLRYVLGDRAGADEAIKEMKPSMDAATDVGEASWVQAAQGEMNLLQYQNEKAESAYRSAAACLPQRDRKSSRRQAELIVRHSNGLLQDFWSSEKFNAVFGDDTTEA
jgi:hypothetical protein